MGDMASGKLTTPGQRLGALDALRPGIGSYERDGQIYASLVGTVAVAPADSDDLRPVVMVSHCHRKSALQQVPTVGQVVMGRVSKITATTATVGGFRKTTLGDNSAMQTTLPLPPAAPHPPNAVPPHTTAPSPDHHRAPKTSWSSTTPCCNSRAGG